MPNSINWNPTHLCEDCDAELYSHDGYELHVKVIHEEKANTFCGHKCEGVQSLMRKQKAQK